MIAGTLDAPRKGLNYAVEALSVLAKRRPRTELLLVGGWHNRPDRLPGFCSWLGFRSPDEVRHLLNAAQALILPSLFEEFGFVGLEALAAGCPVVCTKDVGLVGLPTNGILVSPSHDPTDLADALETALSVPEVEYPDVCRASVAVPRLVSIYEAVLSRQVGHQRDGWAV
jgi:glycosyltransferase involved in cell wall biosynthesis